MCERHGLQTERSGHQQRCGNHKKTNRHHVPAVHWSPLSHQLRPKPFQTGTTCFFIFSWNTAEKIHFPVSGRTNTSVAIEMHCGLGPEQSCFQRGIKWGRAFLHKLSQIPGELPTERVKKIHSELPTCSVFVWLCNYADVAWNKVMKRFIDKLIKRANKRLLSITFCKVRHTWSDAQLTNTQEE